MKNIDPNTDCSVEGIKHRGRVTAVEKENYYVSIITQSACSACHAKGSCHISGMGEEVIEIPREPATDFRIGDEVNVVMEKSLGPRAALLGYGIPFLLIFITLVLSLSLSENEGLAGILSLLIVIPYYLLLYAFRDRLKKTFVFRIMEI